LDQALELRALALVAQVDGDRELVAVETLEDRRGAVPKGRRPLPRVIAAVALLDLDHRGAEVGEDFGRVGRGDAVPELDDGDVGEGRRGSHGSPGVLTASRYTPRPNPTSRLAASAHRDYRFATFPTEDTPMPAPLTRSLGSFAASLKYEMLPAKAVEAVRLGFTDCLAVLMAGGPGPGVGIVPPARGGEKPEGGGARCLGPPAR